MDKNQIAVAIFNKMAKDYQGKFMDVNLYGATFDFFCSLLPEKAEILELACGPGNITRYLLNKRPDFKILGTDLAANMVALAQINNPTAEFKIMDCRNIGEINQKYDAIMCGFCLPYLAKEEMTQLISNASKVLKTNGLLYLSTMEDEYVKSAFKKGSGGDEIFMHYYQAEDLIEVLQKNHFKILQLVRQDYPTQDGTKTTDLVIIACKETI